MAVQAMLVHKIVAYPLDGHYHVGIAVPHISVIFDYVCYDLYAFDCFYFLAKDIVNFE